MPTKSRSLRSLNTLGTLKLEAKLGPTGERQEALVGQSPETPMNQADSRHFTNLELLSGGRGALRVPSGINAPTSEIGTSAAPSSFSVSPQGYSAAPKSLQGAALDIQPGVDPRFYQTPSTHNLATLRAHAQDELAAIAKNPNNLFADTSTKLASGAKSALNTIQNVAQYHPANLATNPELLKKTLLQAGRGAAAAKGLLGSKAAAAGKAAGAGAVKAGSVIKAILSALF